ncbi:MAG TPA: MlaD family protein [Solirubrobacterales bacterium]
MSPLAALRRRLGGQGTRVVVAAALALTALLALYIAARSTAGTYELRAVFSDVRGLIPGGEVVAGGVRVGTVTDVSLGEGDMPVATLAVDDDFRVHEGARANIRLGSNVGAVNRVVELTEGDPTAPELEDGATLAGAATDQPVNFDEAVELFRPRTRARLKDILGGLDAALAGRGRDLARGLGPSARATNELADLLADVNADGEALRTLVRQGGRVLGALAEDRGGLAEGAGRLADLLRTTGERQAELAESVQRLAPALGGARDAFERLAAAAPRLRELVRRADPVVAELGPLARELPPSVKAAAPLLRETRLLVEGGPRDLRRIAPLVDAAAPIAPRLDPLIRDALPFAQVLRVYAPEAIAAMQNFGAMQGGYDAVGHLWNNPVTLAQLGPPPSTAQGGSLGPTDCGPGLLEVPFIRAPGALECEPWLDYRDSFIFPPGEEAP